MCLLFMCVKLNDCHKLSDSNNLHYLHFASDKMHITRNNSLSMERIHTFFSRAIEKPVRLSDRRRCSTANK